LLSHHDYNLYVTLSPKHVHTDVPLVANECQIQVRTGNLQIENSCLVQERRKQRADKRNFGVYPEQLSDLFLSRGVPNYIRSDNGSEFTAQIVREWLQRIGVKTLFIEPGSPWENGYVESFNGKFRDECLNREIFYTLTEAKVLIERWRREYNVFRPHSSLGYRPPAPAAITPLPLGSAPLHPSGMALGLT
jgi:putative transposase